MSSSPIPMPLLALLAGGVATRLRPITETLPKAMVQVAGEPFISHQLKLLKREGIEGVVICAGYLGEQIRDFVQDGTRFGLKVAYSFDGEELLGTGGALRKALPLLGDIFWVMYGDSYLDISFSPLLEYFLAHDKAGFMAVFCNNNQGDRSNVLYENGSIRKYDKDTPSKEMRHIDYGLGLLRRSALEPWPEGSVFDLAQLYMSMVERGELLGYEVRQRFYEVGSVKGLEETEAYLTKRG